MIKDIGTEGLAVTDAVPPNHISVDAYTEPESRIYRWDEAEGRVVDVTTRIKSFTESTGPR